MKRTYLILAALLGIAMLIAAPVVTNVSATQRTDGSYFVDVYYNVSNSTGAAMTIMLTGSNDNGYSWNIPCNTVSGDVGQNIAPGNNKHIVWNAGTDLPNTSCANFKFRVVAFDGSTPPIPADFVYVNGGTYTMGNTLGGGSSNEFPLHQVTLSSFLVSVYEVTSSDWFTVMGSGGNPGSLSPKQTNWYGTIAYCNKRSIAEGLTPVYSINGYSNPDYWGAIPSSSNATWNAAVCNWSANGYRLPTEAEWEYAARGGVTAPDYTYSGSNNINLVACWIGNSGQYQNVINVGNYAYNGLFLYDMTGNVNEWCWDWYSEYTSEGQANPTGPNTGTYRVMRGGSANTYEDGCRISKRTYGGPTASDRVGFRLFRSVDY